MQLRIVADAVRLRGQVAPAEDVETCSVGQA
jgi:hypothetical protein